MCGCILCHGTGLLDQIHEIDDIDGADFDTLMLQQCLTEKTCQGCIISKQEYKPA